MKLHLFHGSDDSIVQLLTTSVSEDGATLSSPSRLDGSTSQALETSPCDAANGSESAPSLQHDSLEEDLAMLRSKQAEQTGMIFTLKSKLKAKKKEQSDLETELEKLKADEDPTNIEKLASKEEELKEEIRQLEANVVQTEQDIKALKDKPTSILVGNVCVEFIKILEQLHQDLKDQGKDQQASTVQTAIAKVNMYIARRDYDTHEIIREDAEDIANIAMRNLIDKNVQMPKRQHQHEMQRLLIRGWRKAVSISVSLSRPSLNVPPPELLPTPTTAATPASTGKGTRTTNSNMLKKKPALSSSVAKSANRFDSISRGDEESDEDGDDDNKYSCTRRLDMESVMSSKELIAAQSSLQTTITLQADEIETLSKDLSDLEANVRRLRNSVCKIKESSDSKIGDLNKSVVALTENKEHLKRSLNSRRKRFSTWKSLCQNQDNVIDAGNVWDAFAECILDEIDTAFSFTQKRGETVMDVLNRVAKSKSCDKTLLPLPLQTMKKLAWLKRPHVENRNFHAHHVEVALIDDVLTFIVDETGLSGIVADDVLKDVKTVLVDRNESYPKGLVNVDNPDVEGTWVWKSKRRKYGTTAAAAGSPVQTTPHSRSRTPTNMSIQSDGWTSVSSKKKRRHQF